MRKWLFTVVVEADTLGQAAAVMDERFNPQTSPVPEHDFGFWVTFDYAGVRT